MSISTCLSKCKGRIIIGATLLLVGGVIYYVRKKKIDSIHTSPITVNAIVESGIKNLKHLSTGIAERDRQADEIIKRTDGRIVKLEVGIRRAEERQREITELTDRAGKLLEELRKAIK